MGTKNRRKPLFFNHLPLKVSACFAVRHNGAGEHDDLVIAVALAKT